MSTNNTLTALFTNIANVIRAKTGTSEAIKAEEFPQKISALVDSKFLNSIIDKTITSLSKDNLVGLTSIASFSFSACDQLTSVELPEGIISIGQFAFSSCGNLTHVTLPSSITSIATTAFNGCDNLTTINVPWSSGGVGDAPWGATNAVINYNYSGT